MAEIGTESKKHMCRFCNKSFPCGRSLGGHMRSHVINSTDDDHQVKNKIGSIVLDKICKECGKGFQSWKALFGHMKCHSIKLLNSKNKKIACLNQDSWTSSSDIENSDSKDRSRSRPRNKRYVNTTGLSLISLNANCNQISSNNDSTSMVSEIVQEQEAEVAVSLMMLSRDFVRCDEFESSNYCYKSSVLVSLREIEGKDSIRNRYKMNKFAETKVGFDFLGRSEVGFAFKDSNKRKFDHDQIFCEHKASHQQLKRDFDSKIQHENRIGHKPVLDHDETINRCESKTSNNYQESSSFNLGVGSLKKKVVLRAYECPICFKTFTSGQALGGHKRSHMISEAKLNQENKTIVIKKPDDERKHDTRVFLDLNMLPEEEEMNMSSSTTEYKSKCWDDSSDHHSHESRIPCLLSTS